MDAVLGVERRRKNDDDGGGGGDAIADDVSLSVRHGCFSMS